MALEISGDALIGASIALIAVAIGQTLQYYFSTKKEHERMYIKSIQKAKAALHKARFNIRDLYISSVKIDSYPVIPLNPKEWKDFSRNVVLGLMEVSSSLYTLSKTKDIANSIDEIYADTMNFTLLLEEKTRRFTKIIDDLDSDDGKEIYKKYSDLLEKIDNILTRAI